MAYSIGFQVDGMSGPGSGTWTRFSALVTALRAYGNKVHISGEIGIHELATELGASSVTLKPPQSAVMRVFNRMHVLNKFVKQSGLDVIHLEAPPFIGSRKVPTIAAIHDTRHFSHLPGQSPSLSSAYQKFVVGRFAPNISAWLALSNSARTEICQNLKLPESNVFVVPPIVQTRSNSSVRVLSKFNIKGDFALILGHLEPRKNAETVLRATFLPEWPSTLGLVVAGSDHGSLGSLQRLAHQSPAHVWFIDSPSEAEKWGLLEHARVVLIPSIVEGFGIVALEAALAQTVYLVSATTATAELAGDSSAALSPFDPSAWARSVSLLLRSNKEMENLRSTQASLLEQYSPTAVLPKLESVYEKLLSDR